MNLDRDFLILLVGRIGQALLALLSIRVLTTMLSREDVGLTYLVASLASYFVFIFISPLGMYLTRHVHQWQDEGKLKSVFKVLNWYFFVVAFISGTIVYACHRYFNIGSGFVWWQLCVLVALNIYILTWFQTLGPNLNILGQRRDFVSINLGAQILGLVFSILGIIYLQKNAFIWLMGILVAQALACVFARVRFSFVLKPSEKINATNLLFNRSSLNFCLPVAITTAFMWGQGQSFRILVESKAGAEALAVLSVGFGVAVSIAGLVESLVGQYFQPRYYAAVSKGDQVARQKAWHDYYLNAVSVYVPTTLFVICCAKFLLKILVSGQFADSLTLVIWGALIEFFRMMTNVFYAVSQSEMKTRTTVFPYLLGAGLVVLGLWFTIEDYITSYQTLVPLILTIAGFLTCAAMYLNMKKILSIDLALKFLIRCLVYSVPFVFALLIPFEGSSFILSLSVCGLCGIYLLLVIWQLQKHIQQVGRVAKNNQ